MLAKRFSIALAILIAGGYSASLASGDLVGCDIVNIAKMSVDARGTTQKEATQYYKSIFEFIVIAMQHKTGASYTLEEISQYQLTTSKKVLDRVELDAYLNSDSCVVLANFNNNSLAEIYMELITAGTPVETVDFVKSLIDANEEQLRSGLKSVRFRSEKDRDLFKAGYYCTNASILQALLSERRKPMFSLKRFGTVRSCKEFFRTQ